MALTLRSRLSRSRARQLWNGKSLIMAIEITTAGAVIGGLATTVGPAVTDILKRMAGPGADDVGIWLRDRVQSFRRGNAAAIASKTEAMLRSAGAEPAAVPLRFLLPALEAASLEDREAMQDHWAALLANAASGEQDGPAFVQMLARLAPRDADVLRACGRIDGTVLFAPRGQSTTSYVISRAKLLDETRIARARDLEESLDVLVGLRFLDPEPALYPLSADDGFVELSLRMTDLGRAFLRAVTPPSTNRPPATDDRAVGTDG